MACGSQVRAVRQSGRRAGGTGVLPNGDVWAWQAKYLFEFDASAASQVTSSVSRALESEPRLKRYFVALPADLPVGDTDRRPQRRQEARLGAQSVG